MFPDIAARCSAVSPPHFVRISMCAPPTTRSLIVSSAPAAAAKWSGVCPEADLLQRQQRHSSYPGPHLTKGESIATSLVAQRRGESNTELAIALGFAPHSRRNLTMFVLELAAA